MTDVVQRRRVAEELVPKGGDIGCLDTRAAADLDAARLEHLASLGLPPHGAVRARGRSRRRSSHWLLQLSRMSGARTEGRPDNVDELRRRRPDVTIVQADVEESLGRLGRFDVVFCYGLLYHLENPSARFATWLRCAMTSCSSRPSCATRRLQSSDWTTRRRRSTRLCAASPTDPARRTSRWHSTGSASTTSTA